MFCNLIIMICRKKTKKTIILTHIDACIFKIFYTRNLNQSIVITGVISYNSFKFKIQ